jgi:hypothetical protein
MSSCEVTVKMVRFSLTINFFNRFLTNSQENILEKSVHWGTICSMLTNGPMGKQTGWNKWSLIANLRRRLKVNTKSYISAERHDYYFTIFYIVLLFEVFYLFNVCDIANICCLQNWGDYTDVSQAVIVYVTIVTDVLLICWFGSQLTQHVRQNRLM